MRNEPKREATSLEVEWHRTLCHGTGWLTPDTADHPIPCLYCKSHLRSSSAQRDYDRFRGSTRP